MVDVYPLLPQDLLVNGQEPSSEPHSLVSLCFVRRREEASLEVPYLQLLLELARIEVLVHLQVLERIEVEVAQEATTLHLLVVKLALVGHRREPKEATNAATLRPAVLHPLIFKETISIVDHIEALLDEDIVEVACEDEAIGLHGLVELEEEI